MKLDVFDAAFCLVVFISMAGCAYVDRSVANYDQTEKEFQAVREKLTNHRYIEALAHSRRALKLTEERTGMDSIYTAAVLNDIGNINLILGDYEAAEPALVRALEIREKKLNRNSPDLAVSLNNLGVVYQYTGDYERASALYLRALEINKQYLGANNFEAITNMTNLAHTYLLLGELDNAESVTLNAAEKIKELLGENNHYLANAEGMLGRIYLKRGKYDAAESQLEKAIEILSRISSGGRKDPATADLLEILAEVFLRRNQPARAENVLRSARTSLENTFGPTHPAMAGVNEKVAYMHVLRGEFRQAIDYLGRGLKCDERVIDQAMGFSSEQKRLRFLSRQRLRLDKYLSLTACCMINDANVVEQAFNAWLRRKGLVLETQRQIQEALFLAASPEVQAVFQELVMVRRQLSNLFFSPINQGDLKMKMETIAELENRKDRLEAKLGRLSRNYAVSREVELADVRKLQNSLPANAVLIELARVVWFDYKKTSNLNDVSQGRYLAFVLPAKGNPSLFDLGPSSEIERTVSSYKKSLMDSLTRPDVDVSSFSRKLHNLVFAPLRTAIGSARSIYLSPDDVMNLMPFEVMQDSGGRFLIEDYTFTYLNVGRDLAGLVRSKPSMQGGAVLIGDPDFDLEDGNREAVLHRLGLHKQQSGNELRRSKDMMGLKFTPLPGARDEVEAIMRIFPPGRAEVFTGQEALEEVVRQKSGAGILHFATHGFFLSNENIENLANSAFSENTSDMFQQLSAADIDQIRSPLLRSGLALAGANQTLRGENTQRSDGLLTAEKVLGLNLGNTEMVVLSACETGLGEVKSGEGVFGLRRAFTQAGAKSIVMSLWSVPDRETKELMEEMYRQISSGKVNRAEALRRAALNEMKTVENRYGKANPLFWGAFVYLGAP